MVLNDLAESSNLKETMLRNERLEDERLARQYKMVRNPLTLHLGA